MRRLRLRLMRRLAFAELLAATRLGALGRWWWAHAARRIERIREAEIEAERGR